MHAACPLIPKTCNYRLSPIAGLIIKYIPRHWLPCSELRSGVQKFSEQDARHLDN